MPGTITDPHHRSNNGCSSVCKGPECERGSLSAGRPDGHIAGYASGLGTAAQELIVRALALLAHSGGRAEHGAVQTRSRGMVRFQL